MIDLNNKVKECGYNYCGYCGCGESDHYWLKCPFKILGECPVHNDKNVIDPQTGKENWENEYDYEEMYNDPFP